MTNNEIKLELAKTALTCGMPIKAVKEFYDWIMEEPEQKVSDEKQIQSDDTPIEELPESEDERIRKEILDCFKAMNANEWIAWLEKQGEQKSIDDLTPQEAMDIAVTKCFEEGEQKPTDKVEPKFKVGDTIRSKYATSVHLTIEEIKDGKYYTTIDGKKRYWPIDKQNCYELVKGDESGDYELVEKEHNNWSEEDKHEIQHIIDFLNHPDLIKATPTIADNCKNWLKSLKDRVQPKQEWSEEDEKKRKRIMHRLSIDGTINNKDLADINDWLKSPKPQNKWKPSEEDKRKINRIYSILGQAADTHAFSTTCRLIGDKECIELRDFLKSLRPQNRWKPDSSMLTCLEYAIKHINKDGDKKILSKLLEQLKEL